MRKIWFSFFISVTFHFSRTTAAPPYFRSQIQFNRAKFTLILKLSTLHWTITRARICKPFKEPRNRFPASGPVRQPYLTYRPSRLHRLRGIDSLEPIPGLLKRLQIRAHRLFAFVNIGWRINAAPFKASICHPQREEGEIAFIVERHKKHRTMQNVVIQNSWPVKGLCGRCLSVWGPDSHTSPPPPYTLYSIVYTYIIQYTYSHREEGEVVRIEPETRWEGQQFSKMCWKYQHDWLYLQSL